jgi:hypothetical protein
MMTSESSRLFVSFWHVCLANLPIGAFCHRRLNLEEARVLISQAQQGERLHCVSDDDLLAPYHDRALKRHRELCEVLQSHCEINITLKDFAWDGADDEGKPLYSIMPLQIAQVEENQKLLVITCGYEWLGIQEELEKAFKISLDSIEFHLFETV